MIPTVRRATERAGVGCPMSRHRGHRGAWPGGGAWSACPRRRLALALDKPLYGVNHLVGHVAVDQLEHGPLPKPVVALLVSGGHRPSSSSGTSRPTCNCSASRGRRRGRGLDKVARLLNLPYPGGPPIDHAARNGAAPPSTSRAANGGRNHASRSPVEDRRGPLGRGRGTARGARERARRGRSVPGGGRGRPDPQGSGRVPGARGAPPGDQRRGGR